MPSRERFAEDLQDAFRHLHDVVYLRDHPLLALRSLEGGSAKEQAFALQQALLDAVDELRPGPDVPPDSLHWRRYRLLDYRYRKALNPRATARELGISRRQFYRDHGQAMEKLVSLLWVRLVDEEGELSSWPPVPPVVGEAASGEEERLALLRVEAARLARAARTARVPEVLNGVLPLLRRLREANCVSILVDLEPSLPEIAIEPALLRQILLSVLGRMCERVHDGVVRLGGQAEEGAVWLRVSLDGESRCEAEDPRDADEWLAGLQGMASPSESEVRARFDGQGVCAIELRLPRASRLILVVDDNEDVLELFQRHLAPHGYHVMTVPSAARALELAEQHQPYAITLDLLMPEVDGWDLLQTLLHRPRTQHIPLIVCSVLRQRELALSLGATAFLIKPVSEQALLEALEALEDRRPA
ncbi:MAG: response regulator [Anaerolineae bacterium]|jgi:CheY-like chemotaxis protein